MGKVRDMKAKARRLAIKERRLNTQAAFLAGGEKVLIGATRKGYDEGYEAGRQAAFKEVDELARQHRRMTQFVHELRKLLT